MLLICLESVEENASLAYVSCGGAWKIRTSEGGVGSGRGGIAGAEQMRPGSLWGRSLLANFSHETSRSSIFGHRFKNKRGTSVLSDKRTDGHVDGRIDSRTDRRTDGRTVLFFQQIIYTLKSHGIIYKWLRDDLVIVVASRCCFCYGLEHARRRPSPSIIVLAINASEICAYQINPKTKKYIYISRGPNKSESRSDCHSSEK